ncbi:hypothetical protein [Bacillus sp. Marseille-P3661]|uniref:hypothetical protein n=1 Tax=Bacillus sp. Marseille-P3661 TaxID=1936234 RepID=UPI000C859202|nr:hypothetical protein [Bacillus sp. Marseille-P3661]
MFSSYSFKKGDIVKVMNDAVFDGEICEFDKIKPKGEHLVKLNDGRLVCIAPKYLKLLWTKEEEFELRKEQLIQLQVLAVDMGDKEWFEVIGRKLEDIKKIKTGV